MYSFYVIPVKMGIQGKQENQKLKIKSQKHKLKIKNIFIFDLSRRGIPLSGYLRDLIFDLSFLFWIPACARMTISKFQKNNNDMVIIGQAIIVLTIKTSNEISRAKSI